MENDPDFTSKHKYHRTTLNFCNARLQAGVAKVVITNTEAGPVNDPLYVKALVLTDDATTIALVTVDAVAIGEIGHIGNDYLPAVRGRIEKELGAGRLMLLQIVHRRLGEEQQPVGCQIGREVGKQGSLEVVEAHDEVPRAGWQNGV